MRKEKRRVLTPEFWKLHNQVMKDLESGMLEKDLGIVLNQSREETLKDLEILIAENKTKGRFKI